MNTSIFILAALGCPYQWGKVRWKCHNKFKVLFFFSNKLSNEWLCHDGYAYKDYLVYVELVQRDSKDHILLFVKMGVEVS